MTSFAIYLTRKRLKTLVKALKRPESAVSLDFKGASCKAEG